MPHTASHVALGGEYDRKRLYALVCTKAGSGSGGAIALFHDQVDQCSVGRHKLVNGFLKRSEAVKLPSPLL